MSLTPETRKENFLARIAGDPGKVLEPHDREEWFLQRIIDTGGVEVTPGSVVDATAAMTPEQAAQTVENLGVVEIVPTSAEISPSGLISYKNTYGVTLFTLQLPLYAGGVE